MIAAMIICDKGSITIGGALDSVIRYLYTWYWFCQLSL